MTAAIMLLRGVNVVGRNKIKMDELKSLGESIGLRDVRTYIQSGNVVFQSDQRTMAGCAKRMEMAIEKECGFRPMVTVRTVGEVRKIIANNPFAGRPNLIHAKLLVSFLERKPTPKQRESARMIATGPEEVHILGREMHIYYANGVGLSKLPIGRIEKALGTSGTARNWNTVTRLLEMAQDVERG